MVSAAKQSKKAARTLQRLQGQQAKRVSKIAGLRRRLEKRSRQTMVIEAQMAALERQAYQPGPAVSRKALRPARLIINPTSGSFAQLAGSPEKLVAALRAHGILATVYLKTSTKQMRGWVREAVNKQEGLVIAAGGDGTIGDVAAELVGTQTVLGILPTGTMNNLARELGIPLDLEQACALLGAGITRQIDVGRVRANDQAKGTYFLETAGLGLAIALSAGQDFKKGRWGKLPAAFRKMFERAPAPIEIELENGEKIETQVQLVTVSNAPLYGLNNLIAPDAKMDDGLLDLAVYDHLTDFDLAGHFLKTGHGQRITDPNIHFHHTRRVTIRSGSALPNIADKTELPAQLMLEFDLIPRVLTMIVGNGMGLNWPVEAVTSVPPLAGPQVQPRTSPVTDAVKPANGVEHPVPEEAPPSSGMALAGAR